MTLSERILNNLGVTFLLGIVVLFFVGVIIAFFIRVGVKDDSPFRFNEFQKYRKESEISERNSNAPLSKKCYDKVVDDGIKFRVIEKEKLVDKSYDI